MKRVPSVLFFVAVAAIYLSSGVSRLHAQAPTPTPTPAPAAGTQTPAPSPSPSAEKAAEEKNPFAPEPAPALPAGMTGSDVNDPRAKLTPGLYNAGEAAMGMKHLMLVKKPDAFQLGTD